MNTTRKRSQALGEASGKTLRGLLERLRQSADDDGACISLDDVVESLGSRAYGPLLVVLGLVVISPVGDIPGSSAVLGLVVALVAAQLLMNRRQPWLPQWVLHKSVRSDRVERSIGWLEKPARFADRHLHPRLRLLTGRTGSRVMAVACVFAALLLVPLELVPGASTLIGIALIAFGMALVTHDGLAALLAFLFTLIAVALIIWHAV